MLQSKPVLALIAERVKAHGATLCDGSVGLVPENKAGANGQNGNPLFDPVLRITPVSFGGDSDLRERRCVLRSGSDDLESGLHFDTALLAGVPEGIATT